MSVMLATTNPAAVAEADPNRDRRVPYEGQVVTFHMRSGEGRGGRMTAPAIITRVEDEDHVELLVIFAADDFITRWKIARKTEQNNVNCWSFNSHDQVHYLKDEAKAETPKPTDTMSWADVEDMYLEVGTLRERVAILERESGHFKGATMGATIEPPRRGRPPKQEPQE
jgi:hypothetical protein